ncbi:hypothetical protein H5410_030761 [Solanum commersonii]|uniref:Uncharacterized protein n=1 Tax=Solanum commersonii TaxID=4109 RepID=A0A9J5YHW1_SOLCO|nr:hypothetical protein H5410_030761 [Solanum commersonii]
MDARKGISAATIILSIIHGTATSNRVEVLGAWEEEAGADVPEDLEARVGKDASAGIELMSTSGDVSTGAAFLLPASSHEGKGRLPLLGPHGHLLLYDKSHVNAFLRHNRPKAGRLRMAENGLILGWYNGVADESKPISCSYTQVPLLDRDSYLNPPRGGIRNKGS